MRAMTMETPMPMSTPITPPTMASVTASKRNCSRT
jgi:hypothetical protein